MRAWSIAVIVSFALVITGIASAQKAPSKPEAEQQLLRLEQKWLDAEDNPDALESILADDYIHVLPTGFVMKKEQLEYLRQHPAQRTGTRKLDQMRVRIYGETGVVTGAVVASLPGGATKTTLFTDVFVYRAGHWQAVNGQELELQPSRKP